jgi:DNA polymerase V
VSAASQLAPIEPAQPPLFGLADCDCFYSSCEAVFRPDWQGRPLVVLGNNDGNIIARSRQAKALGVPMGAALHQVRDLIQRHDIIVCSANFALYGDLSQRVMAILDQYTPQLDVYSIDEAFLGLAPVATLPLAQRRAFVAEARARVARWTGIPVSVGVAQTKTLAKAAAETAKHDPTQEGVCVLGSEREAPGAREALLRALPIGDVWGIGPRRARLLAGYGMVTALDLAQADARWVRQHLTVTGARTQLELRGVSCLPLDEPPAQRQQLCTSRSFGRPVTALSELREAAALFTAHGAERCRAQHTLARRLTMFVTTNEFRADEPQYSAHATLPLPRATADTLELLEAASAALARVWRPGFSYHKLGVILSEFTPDAVRQGELFSEAELTPGAIHRERERSEALMRTLDAINARFGRDVIRPLSAGIAQPWRMKQAQRSPRYTTRWSELAEVK